MSSQVASGHVAIFPVMTGFKSKVTKDTKDAGAAGAKSFEGGFKGAGTSTGRALGSDLKSALTASAGDLGAAATKRLTSEIASASAQLSRARLKQQDDAGRVRVAELKLQEVVAKSGQGSSQAAAAEERLASVRRTAQISADAVAQASTRLRTAQDGLAKAQAAAATSATTASGGLRGLLSNIRNGTPAVTGIASGLRSGLGQLGSAASTGFQAVVSAAQRAGTAAGEALRNGLAGASTFALAAVGGLVAAIKSGVSAFSSLQGAVSSLQRITGGTVEQVSGLRGAMQLSGMDTDNANTSLTRFSANLETAAASAQTAGELSSKLGFDILDANGNVRDMTELLPLVADKFASMQNGTEKTALAVKLFGKSGTQMLPFLNKGAAGIEELTGKASAMGLVLDETQQKKFGAFRSASRTLAATFQGLAVQIGSTFMPILTGMSTAFTAIVTPAVQTLRGWLDRLNEPIQALGDKFASVSSGATGLKDLFGSISPVVATLGGAFLALSSGGVAGILGLLTKQIPFLGGALGGLLGPLSALGGPLGILIAGFAGFALSGGDASALVQSLVGIINSVVAALPGLVAQVASFVPQLVQSILSQVPALLSVGTAVVMTLVDGLVSTLPSIVASGITLIQGLIAAIVANLPTILGAATLLVTSLIDGIVTAIPMLIAGALQLVQGLLRGIISALPMIIQGGLQLLLALITGIVQALPMLVQAALSLVNGLLTAIVTMLPVIIQAGIQLLLALVMGIINALPMLLQAALDLVQGLLQAIITNLPLIIQAGIQLLLSLVTGLINALPQLITAAIELVLQLVAGLLQMLPQLIQAGVQLVVSLVKGLAQAIPEIIKMLPQIVKAIWDGLSSVNWLDLGAQIIQGIIDGLMSMVGAIGDTVGGIVDFITGFFPHSPAKRGPLSGAGWTRLRASGGAMIGQFNAGAMDGASGFGDALAAAASSAGASAQSAVTSADAPGSTSAAAAAAQSDVIPVTRDDLTYFAQQIVAGIQGLRSVDARASEQKALRGWDGGI